MSFSQKKEILTFVTTCMDVEGSVLSENSHRERQRLYHLTETCNLKYQTYRNSRFRITRGWGGVGG